MYDLFDTKISNFELYPSDLCRPLSEYRINNVIVIPRGMITTFNQIALLPGVLFTISALGSREEFQGVEKGTREEETAIVSLLNSNEALVCAKKRRKRTRAFATFR